MKTKKLTPRNVAPVKRENIATVSRDGNAIGYGAIAPSGIWGIGFEAFVEAPFAGDDAE